MKSRWRWLPRRSGPALAVAAVCALLMSGQPAQAAPLEPADTPRTKATPTKVWESDPTLPAPRVIPGKGTRIAPGTSTLAPTRPKSLPGLENAKGSVLKPGAKPRAVKPSDVRKVDMPEEPEGPYYCQEFISGSQGVGENQDIGPYSDTSYAAELYCNFYLDYAYGVSYVVDRSPGYNGQIGYVGTEFAFSPGYYGASYGAFRVEGDLYDGGRQVEILFELYLLSPLIWGACGPLPGLRYLLCEGVGTDLLHIIVGTGTLGTGLAPPVLRYLALGDSYSSGTGAGPYLGGANPSNCRRSSQTYSYRLAGKNFGGLPIDTPNLKACHGATTNEINIRQNAEELPQREYGNPKRTRLVTVTIGGNDLGFTSKLRECVLTYCADSGPLLTPEKLASTQATLTTRYQDIRRYMRPDGVLVVLSYPQFLPIPGQDPTSGNCPITGTVLSDLELRLIADATAQTRDMIRRAVGATGDPNVIFVDVLDAFSGHRTCDADPWVNGIDINIPDSYHPNARGYQAIADQVSLALGIF